MPFFTFFLTFSLELTVHRAKPAPPPQVATTTQRDQSTAYPPSRLSASSDSSAAFLSASAQQLQQQVRETMQRKRDSAGDAASLSLLETAERGRQSRERALDAECLRVLVRGTAKLQYQRSSETDSPCTPSTQFSWSSLDDLDPDAPSPSPSPQRLISSDLADGSEVFDGSGPRNAFERSLMQASARRERSEIVRASGLVRGGGRGGVARLLRQFEELQVRDRLEVGGADGEV